ncbi:MAG: hypothetical protein NTV70_03760 [Acidobacteria bacterium]|nr:hypothetical protein [Acidobacteriota bacterium]
MIGLGAVALAAALSLSPADVFSEAVQTSIRTKVQQACEPVDTAAIGRDWVDFTRGLDSEADGKQAYVGFLKERYEYTIGRLNEAYGLDAQSFTELTALNFKSLDRARKAVVEDDATFLASLREIVERISQEGLKKCRR